MLERYAAICYKILAAKLFLEAKRSSRVAA